MPSMVRGALLFVLFLGVLCVANVRAQEPEADSLSTEDIYPNGTAPVLSGPELDAFWNRMYLEFGKNGSMSKADLEAFKTRIESGGSVDLTLRLVFSADGAVSSLSVDPTGFASIDSAISSSAEMFRQGTFRIGKEFAGVRQITIESSLTKTAISFRGTIVARTAERAAELMRTLDEMKATAPNAQAAQMISGVTARQDGMTVTLDAAWSIAVLASMAGSR